MDIKKEFRKIRYILSCQRRKAMPKPDTQEEIDVVIPIISKDLGILPLCLEGVRHCVNHPIKDIYIVAPEQDDIKQFCQQHNLIFVEESSVLGFGVKDIGLDFNLPDGRVLHRSGWLFQQLIKLSGKVGTCRYYLCIDADHVLVAPHTFLTEDGRTVFYMSAELNEPYYEYIRRVFPELSLAPLSYVDHKMLFSKKHIQHLHKALEQKTGKPWAQAIIDTYDRRQYCGFSEFELYGSFLRPEEKTLLPWRQKLLRHDKISDYETLRRQWGKRRLSLTFPDYRK